MQKITTFALFAALIFAGCGRSSKKAVVAPNAKSLDEVVNALKWDYSLRMPKTPVYMAGQPAVISLAQFAGGPTFASNGQSLTNANFSYCNLSPAQWTALRAEKAIYPIVWSPVPDARGDREIATIDLKSDAFETGKCGALDFTNRLAQMESIIRRATGQAAFSMGIGQKR